jgi:hypothetical protein
MTVCPSVRMEQLGFQGTDFHKILYLRVFRKFVQKIQDSLKCSKNNGYFTCRSKYVIMISLGILVKMRNISDEDCRENQNTSYVQ